MATDRDKFYRDLETLCDAIDAVAMAAPDLDLLTRATALKADCMKARGLTPPASPWSKA